MMYFVLMMTTALAYTLDDIGEAAPPLYQGYGCELADRAICDYNPSTKLLYCDLRAIEHLCEPTKGGFEAAMVTFEPGVLSVFGHCETNTANPPSWPSDFAVFGCTMDDTSGLEDIEWHGSDLSDEGLSFWWADDPISPTLQFELKEHVLAQLFGEDGNDVINGTSYSSGFHKEELYGGDGVDAIDGRAGHDYIFGGDNGDFLYGGPGDDVIYGGSGDELMDGGDGDDELWGEDGEDEIYGDCNPYTGLSGCTGTDWLLGGDDDDLLFGQGGSDWMHGSYGNDYLEGGGGSDRMYGGVDSDEFWGGSGNDYFCDTEYHAGPTDGCAQLFEAYGGSGTYDRAWVERPGTGGCGFNQAPHNIGDDTIEEGRGQVDSGESEDTIDESAYGVDIYGTPYSVCTTLRSVGGVF